MIANLIGSDIGRKYTSFCNNKIQSKTLVIVMKYLCHFLMLESSGFVYGSMSFVEKLCFAGVFMLIQNFMPVLAHDSVDSVHYFKWILSFGCGGMYLFGLICVGFLMSKELRQRYVINIYDSFIKNHYCSFYFRYHMKRDGKIVPSFT